MTQQTHNYWSIGEVLSLLQDEFPEVTISKIRFLESQGLIDPERTPSGYRRFYQADFDRLQWILTQQRDHYLPLKVIRDRLEAGEEIPQGRTPGPRDGQMTLLAPVIELRGSDARGSEARGAHGGDDPDSAGGAHLDDREDGADRVHPDDHAEDGAGAADATGTPDADAGKSESSGTATDATETTVDTIVLETTKSLDTTKSDGVPPVGTPSPGDAPAGAPTSSPRSAPAVAAGSTASSSGTGVVIGDGPEWDPGLALTLDELAEASGCDVAMIRELERFQLVHGRTVGPTVLYDGEALVIARLAAQFRSFGLDPRHLRTFRVGAEREVALLAQVVEPLRHRRDPETRRKSTETMEDLTDLAASLRAILMRQITREQLPPT